MHQLIDRALRRKNLLFILVTQALSAASTLATFALIGHVLGQEQLGRYGLALAVASPFFIVLGLSARTVYVTLPIRVSTPRALLVGTGCATLAALATTVVGWAFSVPTIAALVAAVKTLDHLTGVCQGLLQRKGFVMKAYMGQFTNGTLTVVAVAVGLIFTESLTIALALSIGASMSVFCLALLLVRASPTAEAIASGRDFADLVRAGLPLSAGGGAIALGTAILAYALAIFAGPASVAVFSVLSSVRTAGNIFFSAVAQSELHHLAGAARGQLDRQFAARLRAAFRLVLYPSVALAVLLVTAGPWVIGFIFNVTVDGMRSMLAVVSLGIVAAGFTFVTDAALSSLQAYTAQLGAALMTMGIVALASVALVPFGGVMGALVALVLGLVASAVLKSVQLKRLLA